MDSYPLKKDYLTGQYGVVEVFTPKTYVSGDGFNLFTEVLFADNTCTLAESFFYFGERFCDIESYFHRYNSLVRYARGRRPTHVLLSPAYNLVEMRVKNKNDTTTVDTVVYLPSKNSTPQKLILGSEVVKPSQEFLSAMTELGLRMYSSGVRDRLSYLNWRAVNHV